MKKIILPFLSHFLFEKIFKKESAQIVGERLIKEIDEHNQKQFRYCEHCGAKDVLINDIRGSEGLFTSLTHVYKCSKCGNVQEHDGINYKYKFQELENNGLIKYGDKKYRYRFFNSVLLFAIIYSLILVGGIICVMILLKLTI